MRSMVLRSHSVSVWEARCRRIRDTRSGSICSEIRFPLAGSVTVRYSSRSSLRNDSCPPMPS
ncbi:Uncharacterised protein [Mycobacterium tuberculosis]|nr:Uncharacterised protein [Mycobacterium tuberculosis]